MAAFITASDSTSFTEADRKDLWLAVAVETWSPVFGSWARTGHTLTIKPTETLDSAHERAVALTAPVGNPNFANPEHTRLVVLGF